MRHSVAEFKPWRGDGESHLLVTAWAPLVRASTYLKHFLDTCWVDRTILAQVSAENVMGVFRSFAFFVGLVIPDLLEDGLGDVSVQIVNEDVL